jgi:hypothetical protein
MGQPANDTLIPQAQQLAARLERISADSYWAHQASGVRGALLRCLEWIESGRGARWKRLKELQILVQQGYTTLENAAREIKEPK